MKASDASATKAPVTNAVASTCEDTPNWDDGYQEGCADYKNNKYCVDCKVGPGWGANWGPIEYFVGKNMKHCCKSCGCDGKTTDADEDVDVALETRVGVARTRVVPKNVSTNTIKFVGALALGIFLTCFLYSTKFFESQKGKNQYDALLEEEL